MAPAALLLAPLLLASLRDVSAGSLLSRLRDHVREAQAGLGRSPGEPSSVTEGWLWQPLDPFNSSDGRSFRQRYWVNVGHWRPPRAPVFLHIGGEGSLGPSSVWKGHPGTLAASWGALVISLEHRFYGQSIPPRGLDGAQLRFLSSRHALADVASARLRLSGIYNISASSPWIAFGGSYAGSLAAWARLKYPHLIWAAVASSAPVQAQLDFSGYNWVVSRSLADPQVGGSPKCQRAMAQAFSELDDRLSEGGETRAVVQAEVRACGSLEAPEDQAELLEQLEGLVEGVVQYDQQAGAPLDVRGLCHLVLANQSRGPLSGLQDAIQLVLQTLGLPCLPSSKAAALAELKDTNPQAASLGYRQWFYQTCTEFGYYITCKDPSCPFSRRKTLSDQLQLCAQVFGLSPTSVAQAVNWTNTYYGGWSPGATRVFFVNGKGWVGVPRGPHSQVSFTCPLSVFPFLFFFPGDIDPWHVLSVLQALGPSEPAMLMRGTSHCSDMAPPQPSDPPSLYLGRQRIVQQLKIWLQEAKVNLGSPGDQ
ncbi:thymus-specific serine protease isoform X1 [Monodelphis domestica]|uniref:thymus-specific serine protease isoform X1 n=1 Tax=Monodelphis domestica TaxID=13616 RepID=UPI0024E1A479|nr:thymus-specific serine protease isoform X1 [Monodelphis domestica]